MDCPLLPDPSSSSIPHTMLIVHGHEQAESWAKTLLHIGPHGDHPDLHRRVPDTKNGYHSVESIHEMLAQAVLHPFCGRYQIFLIYAAERMLPSSSHAVLKLFEEPPDRTVFLLLTDRVHHILPTILSRCQKYFFSFTPDRIEGMDGWIKGDPSATSHLENWLMESPERGALFLEEWVQLCLNTIRSSIPPDQWIPYYLFYTQKVSQVKQALDRGVRLRVILDELQMAFGRLSAKT